jgi:hypothetical protein
MRKEVYERALEILTDAVNLLGEEEMTKDETIRLLVDFSAVAALLIDGERGAHVAMCHMDRRMEDWKQGKFP